MILSLPYASLHVLDSLTWHFDKLGSYSVKSGNHFGCELLVNPSSSGLSLWESWWKFLWRLKVPGMDKMLIWRVCYCWILLAGNLAKRDVVVDEICPIFLASAGIVNACSLVLPLIKESLIHVFFHEMLPGA
ncbi:hypothetical protein Dsin_000700 [Dipteronia sinensis]|uniref:Uncharacterized protein n=1 Tax=Dipteronia sinensis TaxID=43782 RepID=A0AAE0EI13_9ROSI|nr:hypothetical protein Dsin_000700 [Dipteronia sinensis]